MVLLQRFCLECVLGHFCNMICHVFSICVYIVMFQAVPISITGLVL